MDFLATILVIAEVITTRIFKLKQEKNWIPDRCRE